MSKSSMDRIKISALIVVIISSLVGCATPKIAMQYHPQTTQEVEGVIDIKDFSYGAQGGVAPDQIPNSALGGGIVLAEPVGVVFSDAVRREMRQAGISLKTGGCKLNGAINELLIDDLGFSVDFVSDVTYSLYGQNGMQLIENNHRTVLEGLSKFVVAEVWMQNINKMFSENIEQFMKSDAFLSTVQTNCP